MNENDKITNNGLFEIVSRIEDKVDKGFKELNGRVRSLESYRSFLVGAVAVIVIVIPFAFYFLTK